MSPISPILSARPNKSDGRAPVNAVAIWYMSLKMSEPSPGAFRVLRRRIFSGVFFTHPKFAAANLSFICDPPRATHDALACGGASPDTPFLPQFPNRASSQRLLLDAYGRSSVWTLDLPYLERGRVPKWASHRRCVFTPILPLDRVHHHRTPTSRSVYLSVPINFVTCPSYHTDTGIARHRSIIRTRIRRWCVRHAVGYQHHFCSMP